MRPSLLALVALGMTLAIPACGDDSPGEERTCGELGARFDAFEDANNHCDRAEDCKTIGTPRVGGRNCRLLVHVDTDETPVEALNAEAMELCFSICTAVWCPCVPPGILHCEAGRCVERLE